METFPWRRSKWTNILSEAIRERHNATQAAYVSNEGVFTVPYENGSFEEDLGKIGGASFIPCLVDGTKADLIAFVRHTKERISEPFYMGTFLLEGDAIKATRILLERVGPGVSMLFMPR